ncbi:hypothetical protein AAG570_004682 [Ranatra chinensis]|uniref:Uncharacterized protein n=1 Tax=Ranatra chinensis TaxID=642074 RepID=A0ABD0Y1K0_9HEMI
MASKRRNKRKKITHITSATRCCLSRNLLTYGERLNSDMNYDPEITAKDGDWLKPVRPNYLKAGDEDPRCFQSNDSFVYEQPKVADTVSGRDVGCIYERKEWRGHSQSPPSRSAGRSVGVSSVCLVSGALAVRRHGGGRPMKPITLENLRRLVGGGRKKKERAPESSFRRSDSFKRISIRKNYLERGGKGRAKPPQQPPPIEEQPPVIGYGQWIKCMRAEDMENLKELMRSNKEVPPTPPPRKKYSSADSSLEILKLETSPGPVRRRPPAERTDSGLSISLGRVWLDAPVGMGHAPRSLELPRPQPQEAEPPRAHRSLESALKERPRPPSAAALASSRDSGFSVSVPEEGSGLAAPRPVAPAPSRFCRRSVRSRKSRRKKSFDTAKTEMYQVVVGRPPRSLESLRLDPMIFVPPEKRTFRRPGRLEVQEIRDYCSPRDVRLPASSSEEDDDDLYECISPREDEASDLNDADTEDELQPVHRPPVRRTKSARRNLKYLAKPSIHRAPSTLKRNRKLVKKTGKSVT